MLGLLRRYRLDTHVISNLADFKYLLDPAPADAIVGSSDEGVWQVKWCGNIVAQVRSLVDAENEYAWLCRRRDDRITELETELATLRAQK